LQLVVVIVFNEDILDSPLNILHSFYDIGLNYYHFIDLTPGFVLVDNGAQICTYLHVG
jgi:hypothetical protein